MANNYDPYSKTLSEFSTYLERLELSFKIQQALNKSTKADEFKDSKSKAKHKRSSKDTTSKEPLKCKRCGKIGHKTSDCWDNLKNKDKRPNFYKKSKTTKAKTNKEITFLADQFNYLVNKLPFLNQKKNKKKHKVTFHSSNTEEEMEENRMVMQFQLDNNTSEEEEGYLVSECSYNLNKKGKTSHYTTDTIGEVKNDTSKKIPMRVLFDTETTSTIVLQKFTTKKYTSTFKTKLIKWNTLGGAFYTRKKALIKFKLLEFSTHKEIL